MQTSPAVKVAPSPAPTAPDSAHQGPRPGHGFEGPFTAAEFFERAADHDKAARNGMSAGPNVSYVRTFQACATALRYTAENMFDKIALGDLVTVNELAPFYGDWRGAVLRVVGLHLAPDGERWADVIEGEQRHRGNGQYDGETTGFDARHLTTLPPEGDA